MNYFIGTHFYIELESMKLSKYSIENENQKMRHIINVYIKSSELNDPVWDVMDEDEFGLADSHKKGGDQGGKAGKQKSQQQTAEEILSREQFGIGARRKDSVDAGHMQLKTLNRLDIELNEILANVLKEENRQRLLMQGLTKLIEKHKDHFFPPEEGQQDADGTRSSSPMPSPMPVGAGTSAVRGMTAHAHNAASVSIHSPHRQRDKQAAVSGAVDSLFADGGVYLSEERGSVDLGVQVDEKDEFGVVDEEPPEESEEDLAQLGVAPLAPLKIFVPGSEQPYQLRRRMGSFPKMLRVPPVAWTCTTIMEIYLDKIQMDDEAQAKGFQKPSLTDHVYEYFLRTTGLRAAADVCVAQLTKACEAHVRRQPRISLFASQLGLTSKEEAPPMDTRDTDFVLDVLRHLLQQGELIPEFYKHLAKRQVGKSSALLRPDVLRLAAVHTVQRIFGKWLPDGGEDYVMKVRSMIQTDKGSRYVVSSLSVRVKYIENKGRLT